VVEEHDIPTAESSRDLHVFLNENETGIVSILQDAVNRQSDTGD
jgi:hypothetical protein